jgi:hypothetical protein
MWGGGDCAEEWSDFDFFDKIQHKAKMEQNGIPRHICSSGFWFFCSHFVRFGLHSVAKGANMS